MVKPKIYFIKVSDTTLTDLKTERLDRIKNYLVANSLCEEVMLAAEADALILQEPFSYKDFNYIKAIQNDPFIVKYFEKIYTVNIDDAAIGFFKGIYNLLNAIEHGCKNSFKTELKFWNSNKYFYLNQWTLFQRMMNKLKRILKIN